MFEKKLFEAATMVSLRFFLDSQPKKKWKNEKSPSKIHIVGVWKK